MPKFIVTTTARADIEERWEIEAPSADEAEALFYDHPADLVLALVSERVTGNEEDREVIAVEEAVA